MHQLIYVDGTDAKTGVPYEHVFADGRRARVSMNLYSQQLVVADDSVMAETKKVLRAGLDKLRKSLWERAGGTGAVEFRLRPDKVLAAHPYLSGGYLEGDAIWTCQSWSWESNPEEAEVRLRWDMVFGFAMPDTSAPTRIDYSSITREIVHD